MALLLAFSHCSQDTLHSFCTSIVLKSKRQTSKQTKTANLDLDRIIESYKNRRRNQTNMKQQSKSNSGLSGSAPDLQPFISQSSYQWLKACLTFTTDRPLARPCSPLPSSASTANIQFSSHLCHKVHRSCWTQTPWLRAKLGFPLHFCSAIFFFQFNFEQKIVVKCSFFNNQENLCRHIVYLDGHLHCWLCVLTTCTLINVSCLKGPNILECII